MLLIQMLPPKLYMGGIQWDEGQGIGGEGCDQRIAPREQREELSAVSTNLHLLGLSTWPLQWLPSSLQR